MNIYTLADELNHASIDGGYKISQLPELRKKYLRKEKLPWKIFSKHTIFGKNDVYMYHHGGRDEMQFNVGEDWVNGKSVTRITLAFSTEPSHSLTDPMGVLIPLKNRFNECVKNHPELFADKEIWYFQNNKRYGNFSVKPIPDDWFQLNTFIAMGYYIDKSYDLINKKDVQVILEKLDMLFPIYEYVVLNNDYNPSEYKIARMTWNSNGWTYPSGWEGKSKHDSHEASFGFGHEEWNFNMDIITEDGYKYGFLEPINKFISKYEGKRFNILLYSVNSDEKQAYWLGRLNEVEVLTKNQRAEIARYYKKAGWHKKMKKNLTNLNLDANRLDNTWKGGDIINIRFKVDALQGVFEKPIPVEPNDNRIKALYYTLMNIEKADYDSILEETGEFDFKSGSDSFENPANSSTRSYASKEVESVLKHNEIEKTFLECLQQKFGKSKVKRECVAFGQNRIDITRKTSDGYIFYEIKTYNHLKTSLRNAIGQMFEYAFYPDQRRAKKTILVSDIKPDERTIKYINHLKSMFNLPLGYIHFDMKRKEIISEV